MADAIHQYGQIYLGSRGGVVGTSERAGGGKTVEIRKDEVKGLNWTRLPRGGQLGVCQKDGTTVNFIGFREKDYEALHEFSKKQLGFDIEEQALATSGRNWGALAIRGGSLLFLVDGKVAYEVPLRDVSQAQQAKDDVMLELHVDDFGAEEREDMLMEMAFHVPPTNEEFPSTGEEAAAKVFLDQVLQHTDAGAASSEDAVCSFADVAILAPRGRFEVEMHLGFLSLVGQTQDFKVRYQAIQRIFILPKHHTPHTLVVVSVDPALRKGQTYYPHVLCQFPSDEQTTVDLDITPEQLAAKNEKCGGKLEQTFTGPVHEVFARALRGLSGAKITRPGVFRNAAGDGCSIRCSYKADDGFLYPLDRAFFYVHKPPLFVSFEDIDSVEFARQGGGVVSSRTFDLIMRMKNDTEHQFRNINRTEWQNLFEFINSKKIRVENLASAQQGPGGPGKAIDVGDDIDPGMRRAEAEAEDSEDDEDFDAGADAGSASSSEDEDSEGSSDAELIAEEGITLDKIGGKGKKRKEPEDSGGDRGSGEAKPQPAKKAKAEAPKVAAKAPAEPKASKASKAAAAKAEAGAGGPEVGKAKKPKKKKDPNAPKKGLSAYMFFVADQRNKVKEENPGIKITEISKVLGEKWKALTPEQKVPYEQKAAADKERYARDMVQYKASTGGAAAAAAADDVEDDEEGSDAGDN